jgi:hypothetical protein
MRRAVDLQIDASQAKGGGPAAQIRSDGGDEGMLVQYQSQLP